MTIPPGLHILLDMIAPRNPHDANWIALTRGEFAALMSHYFPTVHTTTFAHALSATQHWEYANYGGGKRYYWYRTPKNERLRRERDAR